MAASEHSGSFCDVSIVITSAINDCSWVVDAERVSYMVDGDLITLNILKRSRKSDDASEPACASKIVNQHAIDACGTTEAPRDEQDLKDKGARLKTEYSAPDDVRARVAESIKTEHSDPDKVAARVEEPMKTETLKTAPTAARLEAGQSEPSVELAQETKTIRLKKRVKAAKSAAKTREVKSANKSKRGKAGKNVEPAKSALAAELGEPRCSSESTHTENGEDAKDATSRSEAEYAQNGDKSSFTADTTHKEEKRDETRDHAPDVDRDHCDSATTGQVCGPVDANLAVESDEYMYPDMEDGAGDDSLVSHVITDAYEIYGEPEGDAECETSGTSRTVADTQEMDAARASSQEAKESVACDDAHDGNLHRHAHPPEADDHSRDCALDNSGATRESADHVGQPCATDAHANVVVAPMKLKRKRSSVPGSSNLPKPKRVWRQGAAPTDSAKETSVTAPLPQPKKRKRPATGKHTRNAAPDTSPSTSRSLTKQKSLIASRRAAVDAAATCPATASQPSTATGIAVSPSPRRTLSHATKSTPAKKAAPASRAASVKILAPSPQAPSDNASTAGTMDPPKRGRPRLLIKPARDSASTTTESTDRPARHRARNRSSIVPCAKENAEALIVAAPLSPTTVAGTSSNSSNADLPVQLPDSPETGAPKDACGSTAAETPGGSCTASGRKCIVEGCASAYVRGPTIEADIFGPSGRRCARHGGGRRCNIKGCAKYALGYAPTDAFGLAGFRCARHGGRGQCQVESCEKMAVGERRTEDDSHGAAGFRCTKHGGGKRCSVPNCGNSAQKTSCSDDKFGPAGQLRCARHAGGKVCRVEGCSKPSLGLTLRCFAHGGGRRCNARTCTRSAVGTIDKDDDQGLSGPHCQTHGGRPPSCNVVGCNLSLTCRNRDKDAIGSPGWQCKKHGCGRKCSVLECTSGAMGRKIWDADSRGPKGVRCVEHGAGVGRWIRKPRVRIAKDTKANETL